MKAATLKRTSGTGRVTHIALVRESGRRVHLGSWPDQPSALAACQRYIETGTKPKPMKRGMKWGQRKKPGSKTRWGTLVGPRPASTVPVSRPPEHRVAMMRRLAGWRAA